MEELGYLRVDVSNWFGFALIGLEDFQELFVNFRLLRESVLSQVSQGLVALSQRNNS